MNRVRRRFVGSFTGIVIALSLIASGCGGDDGGDSELTISAASSLTDAFMNYGKDFDGTERFSFAGSDELAAQIRQGAAPDIFAAANTSLPEDLNKEGLVGEPVIFTKNRLVLAVPAQGSDVESINDLTKPDVDFVIGAEGVPVGDYTLEVLDRLDPARREKFLANVRSKESDVKGVVGKIATGSASAGFVYESDVKAARGRLRAIELPRSLQPEVEYGIAVVKAAPNPERAREFIDGLLSGPGKAALAAQGFRPPPVN